MGYLVFSIFFHNGGNSVLIPDPERNEIDKRTVRQGDGAGRKYRFFSLNKDFRIEQSNKIQENFMSTFTAVLHKEDDMYVAECPEVGTVSQGSTVEEAVSNLKEATELYLEEFPLPKKKRAILTTFEVSSVATS